MSALFFDIDGTILSEITHKIPESALEALHKAQENGHKTFINTGRTICSVPPMIKRISFDGFLCGCGTHLIYGEQVVFHHSIPYERGREIIKSMKDCKVEGFLEGTEDIYYSEPDLQTGAGRKQQKVYGRTWTWKRTGNGRYRL